MKRIRRIVDTQRIPDAPRHSPLKVPLSPKSVRITLVDQKRDSRKSFSRRDLLSGISGVWLGAGVEGLGMLRLLSEPKQQPKISSVPFSPRPPLTPEDDLFLEELERAAVNFFWEETNPETGLVKDR